MDIAGTPPPPVAAASSFALDEPDASDEENGPDPEGTYTVEAGIESLGMGRFQYLILAMAGLCYTADAMEMLLISFIKPPLQCLWGISDVQAALITTSVGVGMLFGSIAWGLLADAYGRRLAFVLAAALTFFFGLFSALAPNYALMVFARGVVGFGIGGVPISFSLIMEFLPRKARGRWGMGLAAFWSLGAVFEALLAMLVMPTLGFRYLIGISTLPLGVLLLLTPLLPESPRWLASQGRVEEAESILRRAALINSRILPVGTLVADREEATRKRPLAQLGLLVRRGLRALAVEIWILWFAAAFVYYGAVMLQPDLLQAENLGRRCGYAQAQCATQVTSAQCAAQPICSWGVLPGVLTANQCIPTGVLHAATANATAIGAGIAGSGRNTSAACAGRLRRSDYISALWATTGELPGTIITLAAVDAVGRRGLIGYLLALCAASFFVLIPCPGRMAETSAFFAARAASNGFFQGIYLYTNEVYPSEVRATGMGMASAMARVGLIATPIVAQFLDNVNVVAAISIYAGVCLIAIIAVRLTPIETTRRPLLSTTDELINVLLQKDSDDENYPSFSRDPSVHPFVRFFRWNARIDGRGA